MIKYIFKRSGVMNNLKIKKFDKYVLDKAKLITNGTSFFRTYDLNNGNIIKIAKSYDECDNSLYLRNYYQEFMDNIYNKVEYSKNIDSSSIVLPNCIYLKNDRFVGYSIKKQENVIDLNKYLMKNDSLESVSEIIIKLTLEVRKLNKENINLPDLGNLNNVLIDSKKELKFIDYDGMQIDKYYSYSVSSLINYSYIPFTENIKYCDLKTGLINSNLDKLSLYTLFLWYTASSIPFLFHPCDYVKVNGKLTLKKEIITKYLEEIGLNNTVFGENIYRIHNEEKLNYPDIPIKKLLCTHTLKNNKFILK